MRATFANPIVHARDPGSSAEAAQDMESSGARGRHAAIVLDAVRRHPGSTATELARHCPLETIEVRRRLTDLKEAGLVVGGELRACRVKPGRRMVPWTAVDEPTEEDARTARRSGDRIAA